MHTRSPIAAIALTTAVLVTIVHLMAVVRFTPLGMAPVLIAFPIGLACFAACVSEVRRHASQRRWAVHSYGDLLALVGGWPGWARACFAFAFVYASINFAWFFHATGGGTIEMINGQTVLADHGRVIRALDAGGEAAIRAWQVRLFSGHILPFLLLPGFYFRFTSRPPNDPSLSTPAPQ